MKKSSRPIASILSFLMLSSIVSAPIYADTTEALSFDTKIAEINEEAAYSEDSVLVMTGPDVTAEELESETIATEALLLISDNDYATYRVSFPETFEVEEVMETLADSDDVLYVEPNYTIDQTASRFAAAEDVNTQWHHDVIHTFEAWKLIDKLPSHGRTRVAVIDSETNIYQNDLWLNINMTYSCAFVNGQRKSINWSGRDDHGSHVAGILGAVSTNGTCCTGVASGTKNDCLDLVYVSMGAVDKKTGAYLSDVSNMLAAINYASLKGCKIANISAGLTYLPSSEVKTMQSAIDTALSRGMICVCSSGNSGDGGTNYPASCDNVVAVGNLCATGGRVVRASSSSYGAVDISAPGTGIRSLDANNGYEILSGTSMSAPVVAGVISLVMAAAPSLTSKEAAQIVIDTAVDLGDSKTGAGCVNAYAAVRKAISLTRPSYLPADNAALYSATPVSDHNEITTRDILQMAVYLTLAYNAYGVRIDSTTGLESTREFMAREYTACDFLSEFFASNDFWAKTYNMDNTEYCKMLFTIVAGTTPTNSDISAMTALIKKSSKVAAIKYAVQNANNKKAFENQYTSFSYGDPYKSTYFWNKYA